MTKNSVPFVHDQKDLNYIPIQFWDTTAVR